jgi:hypothetical protein
VVQLGRARLETPMIAQRNQQRIKTRSKWLKGMERMSGVEPLTYSLRITRRSTPLSFLNTNIFNNLFMIARIAHRWMLFSFARFAHYDRPQPQCALLNRPDIIFLLFLEIKAATAEFVEPR